MLLIVAEITIGGTYIPQGRQAAGADPGVETRWWMPATSDTKTVNFLPGKLCPPIWTRASQVVGKCAQRKTGVRQDMEVESEIYLIHMDDI